jgi:hypothetical protein
MENVNIFCKTEETIRRLVQDNSHKDKETKFFQGGEKGNTTGSRLHKITVLSCISNIVLFRTEEVVKIFARLTISSN